MSTRGVSRILQWWGHPVGGHGKLVSKFRRNRYQGLFLIWFFGMMIHSVMTKLLVDDIEHFSGCCCFVQANIGTFSYSYGWTPDVWLFMGLLYMGGWCVWVCVCVCVSVCVYLYHVCLLEMCVSLPVYCVCSWVGVIVTGNSTCLHTDKTWMKVWTHLKLKGGIPLLLMWQIMGRKYTLISIQMPLYMHTDTLIWIRHYFLFAF